MKRIIIVGGGAAAFMAAVTAARNGAEVTILEKENRPLKKFAMTGNGKCNITNLSFSEDSIRSHDPEKAVEIINRFDNHDAIAFFEEIGLPVFEKKGWVYPKCESAKSSAYLLQAAAVRTGVKIKTMQDVTDIIAEDSCVKVKTSSWVYTCDACIVACGTGAFTGQHGEETAQCVSDRFGLKIYPYLPALSGIICRDPRISSWPKVRAKAALAVCVEGKKIISRRGELQLSSSGISGIAAMMVSRYIEEALYENKQCMLDIDFAPDMSEEDLSGYIEALNKNGIKGTEALLGLLPADITGTFLKDSSKETAGLIKHFVIDSFMPGSKKNAQVCQGGIALSSLDETLKIPGAPVWICGEMLDVEGDCGGYNLQWAWSSGHAAGTAASLIEND